MSTRPRPDRTTCRCSTAAAGVARESKEAIGRASSARGCGAADDDADGAPPFPPSGWRLRRTHERDDDLEHRPRARATIRNGSESRSRSDRLGAAAGQPVDGPWRSVSERRAVVDDPVDEERLRGPAAPGSAVIAAIDLVHRSRSDRPRPWSSASVSWSAGRSSLEDALAVAIRGDLERPRRPPRELTWWLSLICSSLKCRGDEQGQALALDLERFLAACDQAVAGSPSRRSGRRCGTSATELGRLVVGEAVVRRSTWPAGRSTSWP